MPQFDPKNQANETEQFQSQITIANRAPTSSDKGVLWIKQDTTSDTTIVLYIRHKKTGTWRSANFT